MMRVYGAGELAASLDEIVAARVATIAFADRQVTGDAAAALMFSSWAVLAPEATIAVDTPSAWAGAVWRIGQAALMQVPRAGTRIEAHDALRLGLCDAVGDSGEVARSKSEVALDAAATLLGGRGGDALERATFRWLFATGVPAEGLTAFLEKRKPRFRTE